MIEVLAVIILILVVIVILLGKKLAETLTRPPCQHVWRTDRKTDVYDTTFGSKSYEYTEIHCQCTKCGVWKKFKI